MTGRRLLKIADLCNPNLRTMKHLFLLAICSFFILISNAQEKGFEVKKNAKGLYIEHTVAAKEGLFSIGRLYNVHPRHLAGFNDWDYNKGLNIGQVINIPLTDTNFRQSAVTGVPLYHIVSQGENLTRIGQFAGTSTDKIKKMNKSVSDNIAAGKKLVIGYLVSPEAKNIPVASLEKPEEKSSPVIAEVKKEEPEKKEPVIVKEDKPVVREEENAVKNAVLVEPVKTNQKPATMGYFQVYYERQVKQSPASHDRTVTTGIFKTVSGWQDGKYYMLIDNVPPGTIVKISNPENGKVVFAKVLGAMEGISLNKGLDMRMSNAAASVLEVPEVNADKFIVQLSY